MNPARRLKLGVIGLLSVMIMGVIGYTLLEGWTPLEALFMTVITISTVGYGEVRALSPTGQVFSIVLIVCGVGTAMYALSGVGQYIIEEQLGTTLRRRRMLNKIAKLEKHFIICGYGRVGQEIAHQFKREKVPFAIIEANPDVVSQMEAEGYLHLHGDATNDEMLQAAGIERARALVIALPNDADNTYVALSARRLRPDLLIIARTSSSDSEPKLKRAGADRVVTPHRIGGRRMAMLALHPLAVDFVDSIIHSPTEELMMEEIRVTDASPLVGVTIEEGEHRTKGIRILALKKANGTLIQVPSRNTLIEAGDELVIVGTEQQLEVLEMVCTACTE